MESKLERNFWRFWLGGLLILAAMIAMNPWFVTDVSPWGIRDHQSAGTALRVDAIQGAWQAAGVLGRAQIGIAIDLVYIAVYSFGAYCGGRLFAASSKPMLARLGWVIAGCAILFALTDYAETIAQFIQLYKTCLCKYIKQDWCNVAAPGAGKKQNKHQLFFQQGSGNNYFNC